jgi:anti-sigma regulatory factor (Ser/Thr protein kinase)
MIQDEDIFSLKNSEHLINLLDHKINLDDDLLVKLKIPKNFEKKLIALDKKNYPSQIRKNIAFISEKVEKLGYSPNIFTTLYEGILNGFQHGNNYDKDKKLILASKITQKELEFIISDQGNTLHPVFSRFILEQRQKDLNDSFVNWYKFSGEKKPNTNNGTGTAFMHAYMDEVKYFKSEELGGLSLYLNKKNKKIS